MADRPIVRGVLLPLFVAGGLAAPAAAQYPSGAVVQPLPRTDDPGERLAAALRTLAVSPNDPSALLAAGENTLLLGDPGGAIGFLGRADQTSPRNGRVKAALGTALVQLQRPAEALPLFAQATALGVPEVSVAADRGLARDLLGDTAAAERDYRLALAARPDDDVARRRLALSQGIAGDRAGAVATLDPLIRRSDLGAWRAQTFVLAMTGDAAGANAITRVMLPRQEAALQPFLVRLAALTPAQKARAVHFGEMPSAVRRPPPQVAAAAVPAPAPVASDLAAAGGAVPRPSVPARTVAAPILPAAAPASPAPAPPAAAPVSSPVEVAAATVPSPAPAVPTATPAAPTSSRIVSTATTDAAGTDRTVRYRRQTRDWHEVFALGAPQYEYVRVTGPAASKASAAPQEVATVAGDAARTPATPPSGPATTAASPGVIQAPLAAAAPPTVAPAASPSIAPPATPAPSPVASPDTPAAPAPLGLPVGASASAGHYDRPVAIARPVRPAPPRAPATRPISAEPVPAPEVAREAPSVGRKPSAARSDEPAKRETGRAGTAKARADTVERDDEPRSGTDKTVRSKTERVPADDAEAKPDRKGKTTKGSATDRAEKYGRVAKQGKTGFADDRDDAKPDKSKRTTSKDTASDRDGKDAGKAPAKAGKGKAEAKSGADRSRVYVQVAGGANRDDMDKAWDGVRKKAPELMKGRTPSTTPLKATNRLLVGPFKDDEEAQAFVNKMAGKGMPGFVVKTAKGQKVDKVGE